MKNIIVAVTGSVAAYKSIEIVSTLVKQGHHVEVIMSEGAKKFIQPMTFEALIKKPVHDSLFDKEEGYQIKHIALAKKADCFIVVPASANTIAKIANGLCDDMLSTTFLASTCPKIIAPAMNTAMYDNLATQRNIERCKSYGITFIEPASGLLACGDVGRGKLAHIDDILENIQGTFIPKILKNKKILITAGPTIEKIDPVRFVSNHSSGKMGYALAKVAYHMGGDVTLVSGPTNLKIPYGVKCIEVTSAKQMFDEVVAIQNKQHMIIKSAAVGDYRIKEIQINKIKKQDDLLQLDFIKNEDILSYLGKHKHNQLLCGFAMETQNVIENAKKKCIHKNCDLLIVNDLNQKGAGFNVDTNIVSFITKNTIENKEIMTKDQLAIEILETLNTMEVEI